jgi:hypothetical protein
MRADTGRRRKVGKRIERVSLSSLSAVSSSLVPTLVPARMRFASHYRGTFERKLIARTTDFCIL